MSIKDQRAALLKTCQEVVDAAKAENRDLTAEEQKSFDAAIAEVKELDVRIGRAEKSAGLLAQLDAQAASVGGGGEGHLALTGQHAKALATRIIKDMPRHGQKALAAGQQTTTVELLPGVIAQGQPAQSLLDVLPSRIVPPSYTFLRQSARNLAAGVVAAGGTKPTSTVGVTAVQNRLRVVATVSDQVDHYLLSDNTNLQSFVTNELVYGLRAALETEIISGDGTGEHFTGILNTSGIQTVTFATSALISVRKGLTALDTAGYSASTIVLSAADWEAIELLAATQGATDNRGVPLDAVSRRLWGYPVVLSQLLGAKVGLVIGDGAVSVDSDGALDTRWTDAVSDDFVKNYVRARVEGRFGISVHQPFAIVKVATAA